MDLSFSASLASSPYLPPTPVQRLTTNDSGLTTLTMLFLRNNLEQPKTTVFLLPYIDMIMKELHYLRQGGCSSVDPQKQPKNVTVTWESSGLHGSRAGLCHMDGIPCEGLSCMISFPFSAMSIPASFTQKTFDKVLTMRLLVMNCFELFLKSNSESLLVAHNSNEASPERELNRAFNSKMLPGNHINNEELPLERIEPQKKRIKYQFCRLLACSPFPALCSYQPFHSS